MKRFTETTKWADPWFRKLPPAAKLLWLWLCDCCDASGVIDFDAEFATFQIGEKVTASHLKLFADRLETLASGKIRIVKFLSFQYGKLSRDCKAHIPVFRTIEANGLVLDDSLSIAYAKAIHSLQEEEEETDQDKETEKTRAGAKNLPTTPQALRIAALFARRPTTAWSEKEVKAFRAIGEIHDDDLALIERYYASERAKGDDGRERRDMGTFLNNFAGELDRAKRAGFTAAPKPASVGIRETPMDKMLRENEEMFADGEHPDKWRAANPGKDYVKKPNQAKNQ